MDLPSPKIHTCEKKIWYNYNKGCIISLHSTYFTGPSVVLRVNSLAPVSPRVTVVHSTPVLLCN